MTDSEKNEPVSATEPAPGPEREGRPASRRRAISDVMMQALKDDMDRRPGVYRRLAVS